VTRKYLGLWIKDRMRKGELDLASHAFLLHRHNIRTSAIAMRPNAVQVRPHNTARPTTRATSVQPLMRAGGVAQDRPQQPSEPLQFRRA
jgi:hypothetical protein